MPYHNEVDPETLAPERFLGYLRAIARLQVAARPWLSPKLDASDLVQQTMLKAHSAREQFHGQSPEEFVGWLRQILMNTLANALRSLGQAKRDVGVERSLEADLDASCSRLDAWLAVEQTSASQFAQNHERAEALANAVGSLPEDQQQALLGKHCHGQSLNEIATQMNRSPAAVAGLLRRGLERLRELLADDR